MLVLLNQKDSDETNNDCDRHQQQLSDGAPTQQLDDKLQGTSSQTRSRNVKSVNDNQRASCSGDNAPAIQADGASRANSISLDDEEFYDCCTEHDVSSSSAVSNSK